MIGENLDDFFQAWPVDPLMPDMPQMELFVDDCRYFDNATFKLKGVFRRRRSILPPWFLRAAPPQAEAMGLKCNAPNEARWRQGEAGFSRLLSLGLDVDAQAVTGDK